MTRAFVVDPLLCPRILAEYRELPGLRLSVRQAARLWSLDADDCRATLDFLVDGGWLMRTRENEYRACQYAAGSKRLVAQVTCGSAA